MWPLEVGHAARPGHAPPGMSIARGLEPVARVARRGSSRSSGGLCSSGGLICCLVTTCGAEGTSLSPFANLRCSAHHAMALWPGVRAYDTAHGGWALWRLGNTQAPLSTATPSTDHPSCVAGHSRHAIRCTHGLVGFEGESDTRRSFHFRALALGQPGQLPDGVRPPCNCSAICRL